MAVKNCYITSFNSLINFYCTYKNVMKYFPSVVAVITQRQRLVVTVTFVDSITTRGNKLF